MRVVYYLDRATPPYLWFLKKSIMRVHNVMPDAEIVLQTVEDFPSIEFPVPVKVNRLDLPMDVPYAWRGFMAYSEIDGDALLLDVDCIMRRDVSHVFNSQFDVALCARFPRLPSGKLLFGGGVRFSRCPEFWKEAAGDPKDHHSWRATENKVAEVAMSDKYIVRVLNGNIYNYSPEKPDEDISAKSIVHYKGDRKDWFRSSWMIG